MYYVGAIGQGGRFVPLGQAVSEERAVELAQTWDEPVGDWEYSIITSAPGRLLGGRTKPDGRWDA